MTPLVRASGLVLERGGRRLVDDVSLDVARGELVALAGPNGAGKSTLLRLLSGELAPEAGAVELDGMPLPRLGPDALGRVRAVMPQETVLQFAFTVREVVTMGRHPHRRTPRAERDAAAVATALRSTDVEPLAGRTFPTLSGGERARTTLARVLAQEAPLLLLDEPVAALDLRHQEQALQVARRVADEGGAVVAALHDLNLAGAYADRVVLLRDGRVAGAGRPWHVLCSELLEAVFGHPVVVVRSPSGGGPLVVPVRSAAGAAASGSRPR
jgi:iron complex transport system ATP-binding protein